MAKQHEGKDKPEGPPPRIGHLDSVTGIMREMANVYREVRRGKTNADRGCKLVYMLREMRCCLENQAIERIEARLADVAEQAAQRGYGGQPMGSGRELIRLPN